MSLALKSALRRSLRSDTVIGLSLSLLVFAVYLTTVSPSVGWEDSGEIAAALRTLGIVHPTGYPLFTLLGRAFSMLPLGDMRVIAKLNLLVAILASASVFFFYRFFRLVVSRMGIAPPVSDPKRTSAALSVPDPAPERIAAAVAALALAFTGVFWSEAVTVEVYALHLAFLSLVSWLFVKALAPCALGREEIGSGRVWTLFAYALGLSFTNHMMTVLLAPAFLWLYFKRAGFGRVARAGIARAALPFVAGLSAYLYLPVRASADPSMNWGDPSSLDAFWRHVSAHQYRNFMFTSWDVARGKFAGTFADLPVDFGYVPLLVAAAGLWILWRRNRPLLVFASWLFAVGLLYEINYDFEDPNFRLQAWFAIAIAIAAALKAMLEASSKRRGRGVLAISLALALPLCPLLLNYSRADGSRDYAAEDFARDMLESAAPGGILYSREYKTFGGPAQYLQIVEGTRPDVAVLDFDLLGMPWFYRDLERRHPGVTAGLERSLAIFADEYRLQDNGRRQTESLRRLQEDLALTMLWRDYPRRPVYVTQATQLQNDVTPVPEGLAYRLYKDPVPPVSPIRALNPRPITPRDSLSRTVWRQYAQAYTNQALYRAVILGDTALGLRFLQDALTLYPGYTPALQWSGRLQRR